MKLTRRTAALVASIPLVLTGLTVTGIPSAQAATEPKPVAQGVAWLESQLVDGILPGTYGPSYGPSIDGALALDEIGGHDTTVQAIAAALAPKVVDGYAQNDEYEFEEPYDLVQRGFYAGPTAKALVLAQVAGKDTATWAGIDLVDAVEDRVSVATPVEGRIEDDSSYGDYANVISQSWAARALQVAGSPRAPEVLSFLELQQCSDGSFREGMTADKSAGDQSCDGAAGTGNVDTTAFVILNLEAIAGVPGVGDVIDDARAWLVTEQNDNGSWSAALLGENANSTGLAARALGDTPESAKAASWLRGHQADDTDRCTALRGDIGAIAFDDAALTTGRADGITATSSDQWRVAAAQVLPALRYLPAAADRALTVTGPAGYAKAGSSATYQVGGAAAGARLCVSTGQAGALGTAAADGAASVALTLPAGTADRTVTVTDRDGNTVSATTKVLDATTLKVKAKKKVKRNKKVKVTVTGLAPGEQVTVRLRKKKVASGTATAAGTFKVKVKAGKKLGKAKISVRGEFDTRSGKASVKVRK